MKKFFILLGVCFGVILCLNINIQWKVDDQDKLGINMNNIEALAIGENQGINCELPGSLDCPISTIKVKYIFQ